MSFRPNAILLALAGVSTAAILAGCGSTGATIDPVAQAAVATSHAGGAQMSMHASVEVGGLSSPMTLTGNGDFNFASGEGEISSALSGLPSASAAVLHGSSIHLTELYAQGELYMQSPLFDGKLPNGARWIKLDLAKLAQATGLDAQSLTSGQSNPAQILSYLKASGGTITKLGRAQIRGTQTTHYLARIDLARAAEKAGGTNGAKLRETVEKLVSKNGSSTVPVEVSVTATTSSGGCPWRSPSRPTERMSKSPSSSNCSTSAPRRPSTPPVRVKSSMPPRPLFRGSPAQADPPRPWAQPLIHGQPLRARAV